MSQDINNNVTLIKIAVYCENIISFQNRFGKDWNIFKEDTAYQFAVAFCAAKIGGLAGELPKDFCNKYADISWQRLYQMYDMLSNRYDSFELDVLWDIVNKDIPYLTNHCQHIIHGVLSNSDYEVQSEFSSINHE